MKKLLLSAAAGTIFAASAVAVNSHYTNYQTKQTEEQAKVAAAAKADADKAKAAAAATTTHLTALKRECEKGAAAYAKLPAFTKTQVPAPNCEAVK